VAVDENLMGVIGYFSPEEIMRMYPYAGYGERDFYEAKLRDPGLGLSEEEIQKRLNEKFPPREYEAPMDLSNEERGSLMDMADAGSMPMKGRGLLDEEYMKRLIQRMKGGPSLYNPPGNFKGGY